MHVLALRVSLYLPQVRSLKAKRALVKPVVEGARRRFRVAAAEVSDQDSWHRAELGFVTVTGSVRHADEIIDEVERFVWSFPDVQVVRATRSWLEEEET